MSPLIRKRGTKKYSKMNEKERKWSKLHNLIRLQYAKPLPKGKGLANHGNRHKRFSFALDFWCEMRYIEVAKTI